MISYFIPMISYLTQNDIAFYPNEIVFYPGDIFSPRWSQWYRILHRWNRILLRCYVFYPNDVFNHNVLFFLNQYNINFFFTFCTPNDNIFYQNDIFLYLNDIVFTPMISYLTPTCLNCFNVFLKLLYTCKNETRGQYDFTVTWVP